MMVFMFGLFLWALDPSFQFLFAHNWYVLVNLLAPEFYI